MPQAHYQGLSVESEEDLFRSFVEPKEETEAPPEETAVKEKPTKSDKKKKGGGASPKNAGKRGWFLIFHLLATDN